MTDIPEMTHEEIESVRNDIRSIQTDIGWSNAAIASNSSTASSTFSQFMSGKYTGDVSGVARKLAIWVHSHREQRQVLDKLGSLSGFVETPTSKKIMSIFKYCRGGRDMGTVVGVPGVSKTETAKYYTKKNARVVHVEISPTSRRTTNALRLISHAIGLHSAHRTDYLRRSIEEYLAEPGGLLIVDEAQHLENMAIEELRSIHDRAMCGLVFMGNPTVVTRLTGGGRNAHFAQVKYRMGMNYMVPDVPTKPDINAILKANNITHAPSVNLLVKIGQSQGTLRRMMKVIKLAQMISTGSPTPDQMHEFIQTANAQLSGVRSSF